MSNALTDNLSKEKIQQLLVAIGSEAAEDTTQIEATEYNWHQPHLFTSDQLEKLSDFTERTAAAMAKKFGALCQGDFNVTIASTTQHFADEFLYQASEEQQGDYYLAFGTDRGHPCALIGIPPQTASSWTTQLLGDTESKGDSDRDLSQLEESLLLDIASAIVEAFSDSYEAGNFHPATGIVRGRLPLELAGSEELCKITFSVGRIDSENSSEAYFLIPCKELEPAAGKTEQDAGRFSSEDISKAILGHLQQVPVSVTAQLASTALTLKETMDLRPCDILLLDKRVDEPIELIVEGRAAFRGWAAKSAGKHAVVITEQIPFHDKGQNINQIKGT